nr:MAG TPA: hypothetical protein [Siphoviridae sp. ctHdl3]
MYNERANIVSPVKEWRTSQSMLKTFERRLQCNNNSSFR